MIPEVSDIHDYIERNKEGHVTDLQRLVRQKSVSPTGEGVRDCVELVEKEFQRVGIQDTKIVETEFNPIVWGKIDNGCERTLAVYLMYDTMPAEEKSWTVPPFDAAIKDLPHVGKCMIARGTSNSKGPTMALLNSIGSIITTRGKLPVNLIIFAEGEEEMGSRSLPGFLKEYREEISTADGVICPSTKQDERGVVQVHLGNKGVLNFELRCGGGRWERGPQHFDIHSSGKAVIDSPAWRLIDALSTIASENGNRILIDDMLKDVAGPNPQDRDLIKKLSRITDLKNFASFSGAVSEVKHFVDEDKGMEDLLTRYMFSTTFNIEGLKSGYIGEGFKTVLPGEAAAKVDVRLVPNQVPEKVLEAIRKHLVQKGYPDIEVHAPHAVSWAKTDYDSLVNRAFLGAAQDLKVETEIWPMAPGTGPWYLFSGGIVNIPHLVEGMIHGGREHSPNEFVLLEGKGKLLGYIDCEKGFVNFIFRFASD